MTYLCNTSSTVNTVPLLLLEKALKKSILKSDRKRTKESGIWERKKELRRKVA